MAAQIFGLWNSSHTPGHMHQGEPLPDSRNTQTETTLPTFASRAVFFVYFAVFLSIMIGQYLFSNGPEWIDKVGLWGLGLFLPGPALGVLAAFQTRRRPWLSVALSLLAIMLIGFFLWRIHDATLTALLAWFCLGAFTAHSLRELIANPSRLKDVNWHWGLGLSP